MRLSSRRSSARASVSRQRGFSLIELLVVCAIIMVLAAMAAPNIIETVANVRLRNSANAVAGLLQEARVRSVRDNKYYFVLANGANQAFLDLNANTSFDVGSGSVTPEPMVMLSGTTQFAQTGAPTFDTASLLGACSGCTTTGDAAIKVAFNARGLPCKVSGSLCQNISSGNPVSYVYFLTDQRPISGWAAVSVSPAGRVKVWLYNGSAWQ